MTTSGPTRPGSKAEFLRNLHQAYDALVALIEPVAGRLAEPMELGGWSVKDVLGHVADWETYVVLRIGARRRGEAPPVWGTDDEQVDAKNAELMAVNQALSLEEALAKSREAHEAVVSMIEAMDEADLLDDGRREVVIGAWGSPVWLHLAGNTYLHYEEHAEAVKAWLERRS